MVGGLPVTLIRHVLESFAITARSNVHARVLYGRDDHHKAEALFKALGRALDEATRLDPRRGTRIPSTKGEL
jgi:imidazoleglycerol-phosphate dehydratase